MTPKEYLSQLKKADENIRQAYAELSEKRILAGMVNACDYSGTRVKTSGSGDRTATAAVSLADREEELNRLIDDYVSLKRTITDQIRGMENQTYSDILYRRYAEYKNLWQAAKEMGYSYERMRHLHGYALLAFGKAYKIDTQKHI